MYVYWNHIVRNGETQHGKDRTRTSQSSVHVADAHTTLRTACNRAIPVGVEQQRTDVLPVDLARCGKCFKKEAK